MHDRSSRPHRLRCPTPPEVIERIEALRRQRFTGQQIAKETGVSPATVSRVLRRLRLSRMRDLEPAEPIRRYERPASSSTSIPRSWAASSVWTSHHRRSQGQSNRRASKRGGAGWEYVHVCIDDASRIAFSQIMPDEKARSAVRFLQAAVASYASLGIKVERVLTDNGSCYKACDFRDACRQLGLRHIRTKPYKPKTTDVIDKSFVRRRRLSLWCARVYRFRFDRTGVRFGCRSPSL